MKPLDEITVAVLELVVEHDGEDGIRRGEIAKLLRARGRLARFESVTTIALRLVALERRGLAVVAARRAFATVRGVDVAEGGMQCRECGCTDNDACEDGCCWVEANLCSACVLAEVAA